jgi:hypothetical protein
MATSFLFSIFLSLSPVNIPNRTVFPIDLLL